MSKQIDLEVQDEVEYTSRKIREALGTQHIGENQSREILEKQFNSDREYMRILYENILKKRCAELGIDPESLRVDWGSMKMNGEDNQRFSMEMVSVGTEVGDDGKVEPIYSVQFTTPNGTFRYPWNHLKETVGNWVKIEGENL